MFILARICGRQNINPLLILSRLAHSRYSQFSGYSEKGLSPTAITDPIDYSANIVYNWNTIEEGNKNKLEEDKNLAKLPITSNNVLSLKEKLLKKLTETKKPLNSSKKSYTEKNS